MTGCRKCEHTGYAYGTIPCECTDQASVPVIESIDKGVMRLEQVYVRFKSLVINSDHRIVLNITDLPGSKDKLLSHDPRKAVMRAVRSEDGIKTVGVGNYFLRTDGVFDGQVGVFVISDRGTDNVYIFQSSSCHMYCGFSVA